MIWRDLVCVPPPHVKVQALHLSHSDHLQSLLEHEVVQFLMSLTGPLQSWPSTARCLVMIPAPHSGEHFDHSDHFAKAHADGHASVLQPWVSCIFVALHLPPLIAALFKWRILYFWPPPQVALHFPHTCHGLNAQSFGPAGFSQPVDSLTAPKTGLPAPVAGVAMSRERKRSNGPCGLSLSTLHADHSDHKVNVASLVVAQRCALQ